MKQLVINQNVSETRIALLDGGRVLEVFIERHAKKGIVGNIYKGKVARVLPGIQSAFVNIGADRSAFLFGGDVSEAWSGPDESRERRPIESLLKEGQEIVVQVAKEPLGSKGPRVTMGVTVPGRYLVLMPGSDHLGISRRIEDDCERERLQKLLETIKPRGMGLIARTAAAESTAENLTADVKYLERVWEKIDKNIHRVSSPALLHQEPDLILKTTRDLQAEDVEEIIVDNEESFFQLEHFLDQSTSSAKLVHYKDAFPIFDHYGVELEIARALSKKVWLPSGGYLVIDQTEALTSFDVNTGRFVGNKDSRKTILKCNLEAAEAVARQLRMRNIGGIIVIDFIDMEEQEDKLMVSSVLEEALKGDKARTNVLKMNDLGLVHLTRKRTKESLERTLTSTCRMCSGRGRVNSIRTETYNMVRDIERHVVQSKSKEVTVRLQKGIKDWFLAEESQLHQALVEKCHVKINFVVSDFDWATLSEDPYEVL